MIQFNAVTWYSKLAAVLVLLGAVLALAFYIGARYQEARSIDEGSSPAAVLTEIEATQIVADLEEVRAYQALFSGPNHTSPVTGGRVKFQTDDSGAGFYDVWVFELTPEEGGHTATFNRYRVGKTTGDVTKLDIVSGEYRPVSSEASSPGGEVRYEMVRVNGFSVPQVVGYPDVAASAKVNARLVEIANGWGCSLDPVIDVSPHAYYEARAMVSHASSDVFSVEIRTGWYCGGPYPTNNSNESVTFDMRTGEPVATARLFTDYARDRKAIAAIVFAEQVREYGGSRDGESCDGLYALECEGDCLDFTEHLAYRIEGNQLLMQPYFPHVVAACAEEGRAPIAALSEFFGPSSILARLR